MMDRKVQLHLLLVLVGLFYSVVRGTKAPINRFQDDAPTLPMLLKFPANGGKYINIIHKIMGFDCEKLGILLLEDEDGNTVAAIRESKMHQSEPICAEIFNRWLRGEGQWPATWWMLVENLRIIDLNVVADVIEQQYNDDIHVSGKVKDGRTHDNDQHKYDNLRHNVHLRGKILTRKRKINDFQLLFQATADVGNWMALCSGLGGEQLRSRIEELRFTGMEVSSKKRDCLRAYYNLGDAYWEDVINVVSSYPITNVRLALKIAKDYGVDFRPKGSKDEL